MPKFFVRNNQLNNSKVTIIGSDVNHIKNVLRLKIDDDIQICNIDTKENFICGITRISDENIECTIFKKINSETESNIYINVFQGIPKSDKMELIIQKSVELRSIRNYSN
ncbi:MAG: RsmE family RNA methyltransferase [Clostridia bacterium]|nr:RsmE family RNA methyltransferase [Clostridia bacterium]